MISMGLANLITPAIAISVFVYLTHFFGKIIEDQNPFSDDRKWAIEINGVYFMINVLWGVALGVALAIYAPLGVGGAWLHLLTFLVLSFISGSLYMQSQYSSAKFFNFGKKDIEKVEKTTLEATKVLSNAGSYMGVGIVPVVLFYFGALEYLSGNTFWIIIFSSNIFFALMLLAMNFSLKRFMRGTGILPVNIYFIDSKRAILEGVRVLKVNEDNIRLRVENKILILNKSEVSKIEMVLPEEML